MVFVDRALQCEKERRIVLLIALTLLGAVGCADAPLPKASISFTKEPSVLSSERPILRNRAIIRAIRGSAQISENAGTKWKKARIGMELTEGSVVTTASDGELDLFLGSNGPIVRMRENAMLAICALDLQNGPKRAIDTQLELRAGQILVDVMMSEPRYLVRFSRGKALLSPGKYSVNSDGQVNVVDGEAKVSYEGITSGADMIQQVHAYESASRPLRAGQKPQVGMGDGISLYHLKNINYTPAIGYNYSLTNATLVGLDSQTIGAISVDANGLTRSAAFTRPKRK